MNEKKLYFSNGRGIKLCGVLFNPSSSLDKPIIILCHGFSSHKNSNSYIDIATALAKKYISSFRFDFFGHGESGGKFENITISEAVNDILHAISFLKKLGFQKIGLMGGSFGGIASLIASSKTTSLFLLALKSPVSNYIDKYKLIDDGSEPHSEWKKKGYKYYLSGIGTKMKLNYTFYKDAKKNNAYKIANKIKIPTFIVHGDKDESVPFQQSVKMTKLIQNSRLHLVKNANHHYDDSKNYSEMLTKITEFIINESLNIKKVVVFGMDGNLLDNYTIKAKAAGESIASLANKYFGSNKPAEYFTKIYIKESGQMSKDQFRIAFESISKNHKITDKIINETESLFRTILKNRERSVKIFPDAQLFLKNLKKYSYVKIITTSVPISKIDSILQITKLGKYINIVCARDGVWINSKIVSIKNFTKDNHYDFIINKLKAQKIQLVAFVASKHDIENAIKHNIFTVAVPKIYSKDYIYKLHPDKIIANYKLANQFL